MNTGSAIVCVYVKKSRFLKSSHQINFICFLYIFSFTEPMTSRVSTKLVIHTELVHTHQTTHIAPTVMPQIGRPMTSNIPASLWITGHMEGLHGDHMMAWYGMTSSHLKIRRKVCDGQMMHMKRLWKNRYLLFVISPSQL